MLTCTSFPFPFPWNSASLDQRGTFHLSQFQPISHCGDVSDVRRAVINQSVYHCPIPTLPLNLISKFRTWPGPAFIVGACSRMYCDSWSPGLACCICLGVVLGHTFAIVIVWHQSTTVVAFSCTPAVFSCKSPPTHILRPGLQSAQPAGAAAFNSLIPEKVYKYTEKFLGTFSTWNIHFSCTIQSLVYIINTGTWGCGHFCKRWYFCW
jgi:hypothetical protein